MFAAISVKNDRFAETILRGLGGFGGWVLRGGLPYMVYVINLVETLLIVIMYYSELNYMYPTLLAK